MGSDQLAVAFELLDRAGRLESVRLVQQLGLAPPLEFARRAGVWRLEIARPDVDRIEYLFEIEDHNGHRSTINDPGNALRASGAFGEKSVLELPGYRSPAWLAVEPAASDEWAIEIDATGLGAPIEASVWAPVELAPNEPAPLLIVHDGPEYAALGGFTRFLGAEISSGRLPPLRAALLGAGDRNDWYAANPAYADALCTEVVDALADLAPATVRVGVGVSLGALAMLHAHCHRAGSFDGLFLQSGSFFTAALDPQERGFRGFGAVIAFVSGLAGSALAPVPTTLTCGTVEENLANNEAMAQLLERRGFATHLVRVRDAHNYIAWRDALDPNLTQLITLVAGAHAT